MFDIKLAKLGFHTPYGCNSKWKKVTAENFVELTLTSGSLIGAETNFSWTTVMLTLRRDKKLTLSALYFALIVTAMPPNEVNVVKDWLEQLYLGT